MNVRKIGRKVARFFFLFRKDNSQRDTGTTESKRQQKQEKKQVK